LLILWHYSIIKRQAGFEEHQPDGDQGKGDLNPLNSDSPDMRYS